MHEVLDLIFGAAIVIKEICREGKCDSLRSITCDIGTAQSNNTEFWITKHCLLIEPHQYLKFLIVLFEV